MMPKSEVGEGRGRCGNALIGMNRRGANRGRNGGVKEDGGAGDFLCARGEVEWRLENTFRREQKGEKLTSRWEW